MTAKAETALGSVGPNKDGSAYRCIATEEGFMIPEIVAASQKLFAAEPQRFAATIQATQTFPKAAQDIWRPQLLDLGEDRIRLMDQHGIDTQILLLSYSGVQSFEPLQALELARLANDRLSEAMMRFPGRLVGLATAPPQDPENAALEIERAITKLGLKGVLINSHTHGEYLDLPKYRPIFETLSKLDVPLYLHPREPSPSMIEAYLPYGLEGPVWGYGAEAGLHALRLIFSGLFDDFPKLRIVIGHAGEGIPPMISRIDLRASLEGHDTRGRKMKLKPSEYFRQNFTVTSSGNNWPRLLEFCRDVIGIDNLLFAIDHPFEDNASALQQVRGVNFSEEEKRKFFQTNAERVFNLDRPAPR